MEQVLAVSGLNVTYKNKSKEVYAVVDAEFSLNQSESLGIVGESGSGKSTMAMAILRLLPRQSAIVTGNVDFLGHDLLRLDQKTLDSLRWKDLSVVFQKSMNSFSPVHRVGEQIEDIYRIHEPNATREQAKERALRMLELVNLGERVYRLYPHEMSGGMLQRVTIAVSLLHEPSLLVMDEATTALDVVTQGQILNELKKMERELKTSRIIITHDMSVVAASCGKIVVMYAGHIVERGAVDTILKSPAHFYTKGLIRSFPTLKGERARLVGIPGYLPDLSCKYEGCIFAERCKAADGVCRTQKPVQREIADGHFVACHKPGEVSALG